MELFTKDDSSSRKNELAAHWNLRAKAPRSLNHVESEYHFKSHLSRLYRTYTRSNGPYNSPTRIRLSHTTSMPEYGSKDVDRKLSRSSSDVRRREESWNTRTSSASQPSSSSTATRSRPSSASSIQRIKRLHDPIVNNQHDADHVTQSFTPAYRAELRKHLHHMQLGSIDKRILGLYHLSSDQQEVYNSFVKMITSFDDFDKMIILQDAKYESSISSSNLKLYSGIASKRK